MKVHLINFSPAKFMVQLENFRSLKISYFKESIAMDNFFYQYLMHVTSMFRRRSISQTENGHLPISDWLRLWRGGSLYTVMADAGVKNDIRSNMWRTGAWQSLLTFFILSLAWLVGFSSRLFAVIRFESIIHEFDPW